MKIVLLGSGASEGIPGLFCSCKVCETGRQKKGKEVRRRTSVIIDDDFMIDFSPDLFDCSINFGIDFRKVKNVFITHTHEDHFNTETLVARTWFNIKDCEMPVLKVYGNSCVVKCVKEKSISRRSKNTIDLQTVEVEKTLKVNDYKIVAFETEHVSSEQSLLYLVQKEGKTYFHCTDSGELPESIFEYLKKNKIYIDVVAFDCTYAFLEGNYYGHMNFSQALKMRDKLKSLNILDEKSRVLLTHISHTGKATHEELSQRAERYGMEVAYDGMQIEI